MKEYSTHSFCSKMAVFIENECNPIKAKRDEKRFEYLISTKHGDLNISFRNEKSSLFTLFTRFEQPELARVHLNCNPHSGKWNFHFGDFKNKKEHAAEEISVVEHITKCIKDILN